MLLAAALAAPVWAWPCQAQEPLRSMAAGPHSPPSGVPEGRDGPAATTTVERIGSAARARADALAEMERLRGEIQTLAAIRGAQAALLAWNRERARTGAPPAALSTAPCLDAALQPWCRLLPATFGDDASGETPGRNGR